MEKYSQNDSPTQNINGRTIIEVLIAMAIFTIGFLAVGTLIFSTTRNNTTANILTQATMLARDKMEALKALPVEQMKGQCAGHLKTEFLDGNFQRVCDVETTFSGSARFVKVTVSWQRQGRKRAVVLRTFSRGKGT